MCAHTRQVFRQKPRMWHCLILLALCSSSFGEDVQKIELKDGRILEGIYDDKQNIIEIQIGTSHALIPVKADDIISASVVEHIPTKDETEREERRKILRQESERKIQEANAHAEEVRLRISDDNARKKMEDEKKTKELITRDKARQHAIYLAGLGYAFDPEIMSASEMDDAVRKKAEQEDAEIERRQIEKEERASQAQREKEKNDRKENKQIQIRNEATINRQQFMQPLNAAVISRLSIPMSGTCYMGLDKNNVEKLADSQYSGRQQMSQWCWAACIQMACAYNGVDYKQENVVRVAKGRFVNEGGNLLDFFRALSAEGVQENGQPIQLHGKATDLPEDIINDLEKKRPLVIALMPAGKLIGHAVLLTGIEIPETATHGANLEEIKMIVRDPWPESPSIQKVSIKDFAEKFAYAIRLRVTEW